MSPASHRQGIVPGCTVTVYLTGTKTLATLYANGSRTPLSNPFAASGADSASPGQWVFWASAGSAYDVALSGGSDSQPIRLTTLHAGGANSITAAGDHGPGVAASGVTSTGKPNVSHGIPAANGDAAKLRTSGVSAVSDLETGAPCTTIANSLQFNNAGAFGCTGITTDTTTNTDLNGVGAVAQTKTYSTSADALYAANPSAFSWGLISPNPSTLYALGAGFYESSIPSPGETTVIGYSPQLFSATAGQIGLFSPYLTCNSPGDCFSWQSYTTSAGGTRPANTEGTHGIWEHIMEAQNTPNTLCVNCTTGATTLTATVPVAYWGTQRLLLDDAQAVTGTGLAVPNSAPIFAGLPQVTVPGLNATSTAEFFCTTQTIPLAAGSLEPGTVTVAIDTTGSTPGCPTTTANLPASGVMALASEQNSYDLTWEMANYTVVDSTHISITLKNTHVHGFSGGVGTGAGWAIMQTADFNETGAYQAFLVIGVTGANTLVYAASGSARLAQPPGVTVLYTDWAPGTNDGYKIYKAAAVVSGFSGITSKAYATGIIVEPNTATFGNDAIYEANGNLPSVSGMAVTVDQLTPGPIPEHGLEVEMDHFSLRHPFSTGIDVINQNAETVYSAFNSSSHISAPASAYSAQGVWSSVLNINHIPALSIIDYEPTGVNAASPANIFFAAGGILQFNPTSGLLYWDGLGGFQTAGTTLNAAQNTLLAPSFFGSPLTVGSGNDAYTSYETFRGEFGTNIALCNMAFVTAPALGEPCNRAGEINAFVLGGEYANFLGLPSSQVDFRNRLRLAVGTGIYYPSATMRTVFWSSASGGTSIEDGTTDCAANTVCLSNTTQVGGNGVVTSATSLSAIYTVATLPACNATTNLYMYTQVSDAISPTYLGTLTGGGTVPAPVWCNGTNWVSH